VANIALAVAVAAVLVRDADVVWDALGEHVPLVALVAVPVALVLGWLAGGPAAETRVAAALVTGVRSSALALAIVGSSSRTPPRCERGWSSSGSSPLRCPSVRRSRSAAAAVSHTPHRRSGRMPRR
jgi:hypothetical protein